VTPITLNNPRLQYLRVVEKQDSFVRQYPVGVFEQALEDSDLELFLAQVDAKYRASDPALTSGIVYGPCTPLDDELRRKAEKRRVRLQSFLQYQGILDFCGYLDRPTRKLQADPVYPPQYYVSQRMRWAIGTQHDHSDDAIATVADWLLNSTDSRFVLLLGEFGTGKTFLLHQLALRLAATALTPVLIEMRALEKGRTLDQLLAQHLAAVGEERFDLKALHYMLAEGRIALLFDGFDELALRVSYQRATEHFDTILQAAGGAAKVVLTSRTQHFRSDKQVKQVLLERAEQVPGLRLGTLEGFDESRIREFLSKRLHAEGEAFFDLLCKVEDLRGLASNPRMLGFIVELGEQKLREARERKGRITAATLYRMLLKRWLIYEFDRTQPRGAQVLLTRKVRWFAVTALALRLWQKTEPSSTIAEIADIVTGVMPRTANVVDPEIATHLIGSGSLLVRDDEGAFSFVHQSVMEWLVAHQCAKELRTGKAAEALGFREMSLLMADFFASLAGKERAVAWATVTLASDAPSEVAKKNALLLAKRLDIVAPQAAKRLAGQDLRGKDLSGENLDHASLRAANLTDAKLVGTNLMHADLTEAILVRADLSGAELFGAGLEGANLSEARLLGADLRGAKLDGALLRRAKLVGAKGGERQWDPQMTFGAALPDATAVQPMTSCASACNAVAWSPDGSLLATGHDDGKVRLWESASGKELRQFQGHQDYVWSVAFSPDGQWLASGSADHTVRLWNIRTGECAAVLLGLPEGWVAFTPQGRYRFKGNVAGNFWHVIALCRFEVGELDPFIPNLRLKPDEPLLAGP
jgi:hypothetical protein